MLPLIVEARQLQTHLTDPALIIVDLCRHENYKRGHIPGAIHVSPADLVSGIKPAVGKLPPVTQLNALFSAIGYDPTKHIIAYDDEGGGWAGRFIWTLDVIGHQHSSYLNGGVNAWANAGLALTTQPPTIKQTKVSLRFNHEFIAEQKDVLSSIDDVDTLIWDARSAEEYSGQKRVSERGGHIPGAINLDWLETMDRQDCLKILPGIQSLLDSKGLTRDKTIITHCQSHHRSGLTYLIGKMLGYRIRAYHGSWSEWGNDPEMPIETGP